MSKEYDYLDEMIDDEVAYFWYFWAPMRASQGADASLFDN